MHTHRLVPLHFFQSPNSRFWYLLQALHHFTSSFFSTDFFLNLPNIYLIPPCNTCFIYCTLCGDCVVITSLIFLVCTFIQCVHKQVRQRHEQQHNRYSSHNNSLIVLMGILKRSCTAIINAGVTGRLPVLNLEIDDGLFSNSKANWRSLLRSKFSVR